MTPRQKGREILRWLAVYCPHPAWRIALFRRCGVRIGRQVVINFGVHIMVPDSGESTISIGDRVAIAPGVVIIGESHPNFSSLRRLYPVDARPIRIGDDVWIGANAVIFPGVSIGERSVIAAGAVVTRDIPADCVAGGVPARKIKDLPGPGSESGP